MQQSAMISCELFVYVLQQGDFATTLNELHELIYNEEAKLRLIVSHYQQQPQLLRMN